MILINIDSLSTTELQYIAQQEGVKSWKDLDREELIDALEEAFGEQDDENLQTIKGKINRNRYCNSLTSYRGNSHPVNGLPGTESLPDSYHDTSIHLLLRDPQWAFAYWSFSSHLLEEIVDDEGAPLGSFFLRVSQTPLGGGEESAYDITIDTDDQQWNINLPQMGASYAVDLCWRDKRGEEQSLARSNSVEVAQPYWEGKAGQVQDDLSLFYIHFSSLVTREGEIIDNAILRELAQQMSGGVL